MTDLKQLFTNENIYFGQENIGGINCTIGYIKKFKWSWFATQLNTFVIVGQTEQKIDKSLIEEFSNNCFKYSLKNNKGWKRGLQSAVGSIAILSGTITDIAAINYCEKLTKKHWSAFEIPVLFDQSKKQITKYKKTPIWGSIYFPFFTKTIDNITSKF